MPRSAQLIDRDGGLYSMAYDADDHLTQLRFPNGIETALSYDASDRTQNIIHRDGSKIVEAFFYAYDANDNFVDIRDTFGNAQVFDYDPLDRLTRAQYPKPGWKKIVHGENIPDEVAYAYDPVGNRTSMTQRGLGPSPLVTSYSYDPADQLLETLTAGKNGKMESNSVFAYDHRGNMIQEQVFDREGNETLERNYRYTFSDMVASVSLTRFGNGDDDHEDEDDDDRQPSRGTRNEERLMYLYDALERQVIRERVGGREKDDRDDDEEDGGGREPRTTTIYDGLDVFQELVESRGSEKRFPSPSTGEGAGGGELREHVRANGALLSVLSTARRPSPTAHYFHSDHLDSTMLMTDARGRAINRYRYDAFGSAIGSANSGESHQIDYLFNGKRFDAIPATYHFYARDYRPDLGRFLGRDKFPGHVGTTVSHHFYGYVNNNPFWGVDALGFWFHKKVWKETKEHAGGIIGAGIGGIVGGIAGSGGGPLGVVAGVIVGGKAGYDLGNDVQSFLQGDTDSVCASVTASGNSPNNLKVQGIGSGECPGGLTVRTSEPGNPLQPPAPSDPVEEVILKLRDESMAPMLKLMIRDLLPDIVVDVCILFPGTVLCTLAKSLVPAPEIPGSEPQKISMRTTSSDSAPTGMGSHK